MKKNVLLISFFLILGLTIACGTSEDFTAEESSSDSEIVNVEEVPYEELDVQTKNGLAVCSKLNNGVRTCCKGNDCWTEILVY